MTISVQAITGNTGSNATPVSSFTIAKPGNLADGTVLYLAVASDQGAAAGGSQAKNTDGTWLRLATGEDSGTANIGLSIFRRVVTLASGEPSTYAFSFVAFADNATSQTVAYGWVMGGYLGVDLINPEDNTTVIGASASGSTTTFPLIYNTTVNAWALAAVASDQTAGATWSLPGGYSNLVSINSGRACALGVQGPLTSIAPVVSGSFTQGGAAPGVGAQVVMRPAPGQGTVMLQGISGGGYIDGASATYATAHSTATAFVGASDLIVGQTNDGTTTTIYRSYVRFDTSSIPANAVINQAYISVAIVSESITGANFAIQVVKQDWSGQVPLSVIANMNTAYANSPSATVDQLIGNTIGLSLNTVYSVNVDPIWLVLGIPSAYTYYLLQSSRDFSSIPPSTSTDELVHLAGVNDPTITYRPTLTIVYDIRGSSVPRTVLSDHHILANWSSPWGR